MTLRLHPVWFLSRASAVPDVPLSSAVGGSTLPGATRTYHAVIDCFSEDCNPLGESPLFSLFPPFPHPSFLTLCVCDTCTLPTDCAAVTLNAFVAFAVLALALAQVVTMLHKRIWLTWKFFLTAFLFVQIALLLAQQLFFHSPVWTFVVFFLKMIVLLFVLYFFAQYYFRVTSHSDELGPFVTHTHSHTLSSPSQCCPQVDSPGVWRAHLLHGRPARL